MNPIARFVLFAVLTATSLTAQPKITTAGILHAATYAPPGLPNGGIAQGSIFSIFGSNLGPADGLSSTTFPLPASLAGVTVTLTQGKVTSKIIPTYVSSSQINAIMPSDAPLGLGEVTVSFGGQTSPSVFIQVAKTNFGTFAVNSGGFGPGVLQNFVTGTDLPVNSLTQSAKPGQAIILWGTGLGAVTGGDDVAPPAGNLAATVEIFVGGKSVQSLYNGRSPCCAGLDQIVFNVPDDAPLGCYVPVQIRTDGSHPSNHVTMAISADGSPCVDPINPYNFKGTDASSIGTILLTHTSYLNTVRGASDDYSMDSGTASFRQYSGSQFTFDPNYSLPPAGSCTAYTATAPSMFSRSIMIGLSGGIQTLSAGNQITIAGPAGTGNIYRTSNVPLDYSGLLGGTMPGLASGPFLTASDKFTVSVPGSAVSAFNVSVQNIPGITWTNRGGIKTVDRTKPLTIQWSTSNLGSAGASGYAVIISGGSTDPSTNSTALFSCVASAAAGTFTVPSQTLEVLPATQPNSAVLLSNLVVGILPAAPTAPVSVPGLRSASAVLTSASSRSVVFK